MNSKLIESIANAVLYEGYMLYPYRPSALKNRQRWNFGVVYPKAYSEVQKDEAWSMQTQCLIRGSASSAVDIKVRFLQSISRQMGKPRKTDAEVGKNTDPDLEIIASVEVGDKVYRSWQEALEREVVLRPALLGDLLAAPVQQTFTFTGCRELEPVKDATGSISAFIVRVRQNITGMIGVRADELGDGLFKLTVLISNLTEVGNQTGLGREEILLKSLISAHTILGVAQGEFISSIDPPAEFREAASDCKNVGAWPVLAGEENSRDSMLSSPIILYDYPQIAPESPGDLFDGTEIDEILALRILTLSDDEKREIRQTDDRAREVLERTENMPVEHFMKLHGVLRGIKAVDEPGDEVANRGGQ